MDMVVNKKDMFFSLLMIFDNAIKNSYFLNNYKTLITSIFNLFCI